MLTVTPALDDAQVSDVDGDGHGDLVSDYTDSWISIAYGPFLAGSTVVLPANYEANPTASQAVIRGPGLNCIFATNAWILPDVDGNGVKELLATTVTWQSYSVDTDCAGIDPNSLFDLGDLRGREVEMADAVTTGLSSELSPLGDVDGDTRVDLATRSALFHGPDVLSAGAAASPTATLAGTGNQSFVQVPWIDIGGDGVSDVIVSADGSPGPRVVDGLAALGALDPWRAGFGMDYRPAEADAIADLTGDGVPDLLITASDLTWVYSGAALANAWADEAN